MSHVSPSFHRIRTIQKTSRDHCRITQGFPHLLHPRGISLPSRPILEVKGFFKPPAIYATGSWKLVMGWEFQAFPIGWGWCFGLEKGTSMGSKRNFLGPDIRVPGFLLETRTFRNFPAFAFWREISKTPTNSLCCLYTTHLSFSKRNWYFIMSLLFYISIVYIKFFDFLWLKISWPIFCITCIKWVRPKTIISKEHPCISNIHLAGQFQSQE